MFCFYSLTFRSQSGRVAILVWYLHCRNVHHRRGGVLFRLADCRLPQRINVLPTLQNWRLVRIFRRLHRSTVPGTEKIKQAERDQRIVQRAQQDEQLRRQSQQRRTEDGQREEQCQRQQQHGHAGHETRRSESQEDLRLIFRFSIFSKTVTPRCWFIYISGLPSDIISLLSIYRSLL